MSYLEPLPNHCPPNEALDIDGELLVYRLVKTESPTTDDFRSQRALKPTASFSGVTECQACGLSVFTMQKDATNLLKLPHFKGYVICSVKLISDSGKIQKTSTKSHHTWWPYQNFDIISNCVAGSL
jgi:hypothetical protein